MKRNITEKASAAKLAISIFAVLLLITSGCSGGPREPIKVANVSGDAPDFSVVTIDGEKITLSDYRGKKAVIVDLWAPWCGPCKMEMPELQKFYDKYSDEVEIIGAVQNDTLKNTQDFLKDNRITFKIVLDTDRTIGSKYPSRSIPFLTVINKEGKIVKKITGYQPGVIEELEKLLDLN